MKRIERYPQSAEPPSNAFVVCFLLGPKAGVPAPGGTIAKVYFKSRVDYGDDDATWRTYLLDFKPPPPLYAHMTYKAAVAQTAPVGSCLGTVDFACFTARATACGPSARAAKHATLTLPRHPVCAARRAESG